MKLKISSLKNNIYLTYKVVSRKKHRYSAYDTVMLRF